MAGPYGSHIMVVVPEGDDHTNTTVCSNSPPLGATCKEVVRRHGFALGICAVQEIVTNCLCCTQKEMDSCELPVLVANGICNEICGRCSEPGDMVPEQIETGIGVSALCARRCAVHNVERARNILDNSAISFRLLRELPSLDLQ